MSRVGRTSGVRYRDLFRNREFSALFVADVSSRVGSQLGKFALAALVYNQTKSPALTAATFAVSYLPGILGGPLLSTLADRWPRRPLLITCDLARAGLMAMIAMVDMPIIAALGILLLVELVRVPFGSARMAMLSDILSGDRFAAGNALVGASQQAVQVIGFGVGAAIVTGLGARVALLADTTSYLLSACLLALFIRRRPAAQDAKRETPRLFRDALAGVRVVRKTGQLPTLFWLLFLGPTALATAEGLAIPYADAMGADPRVAGLFLAATPLGAVLGLAIVGKLSHRQRDRVLIPFSLVVGCCVALAGLVPVPAVIMGALFVAGVAMGHVAHIQASIVGLISTDVRGRVIGLGQTVLQVGQASALLLAGFVAQSTSVQGVLLYTGICASAMVFVVSAVGSPHASKHRLDPRAQRRDRRRERQLARGGGRRLANAAFYYDYYYEEYAPTSAPIHVPDEVPAHGEVGRPAIRPLFADEVVGAQNRQLNGHQLAPAVEPADVADTAPIPRINGSAPAAQRYDWTGQRPAAAANGAPQNGNGQNGNGQNGNGPNGYRPYPVPVPNGQGSNGHSGNGTNGHNANGNNNGNGNAPLNQRPVRRLQPVQPNRFPPAEYDPNHPPADDDTAIRRPPAARQA